MKIKRIICLLLCIIMSVMTLASCEEDILGEAGDELSKVEGLDKTKPLDKVELDLYIITDEATTYNAKKTVNDNINLYLADRKNKKFDTKLTIHYLTEDEYSDAIAGKNSGIVLINGKDMLDKLVKENRLANLESKHLINEDNLFKFAKLNATLGKMLDVAREKVDFEVKTETTAADGSTETKTETKTETRLYFVPNNHIVGSYDYLIINKEVAKTLFYSEQALKDLEAEALKGTSNTLYNELKSRFDSAKESGLIAENVSWDTAVQKKTGEHYYKAAEYDAAGYHCLVTRKPVITEEEAAKVGFGILKNPTIDDASAYYDSKNEANQKHKTYVQAALEIICAINTEPQLRNLLQYGVEITNYTVDKNGVVNHATITDESVYIMNPEHTGDVFELKYCNQSGWYNYIWTEQLYNSGKQQNAEAAAQTK